MIRVILYYSIAEKREQNKSTYYTMTEVEEEKEKKKEKKKEKEIQSHEESEYDDDFN